MTFQPPPPGGNPPAPPPPPPGQWGPPPGGPASSGGSFDPKSVNPLDWALVGIGVLLFLFSFFAYYTVSVGGFSDSTGAWHFGDGSFIGWFAFIAGLAGAVIAALGILMPAFKLPVANYVAAMGLFALSFVLYILGFFIIGPDTGSACVGVTGPAKSACENAFDDAFGFGFSYWASLILVLAGAILALMRAQQTGTALPGALAGLPNIGNKGPQGGLGGPGGGPRPGPGPGPNQPPPPPPGYGQNPPPPGYGPPQ